MYQYGIHQSYRHETACSGKEASPYEALRQIVIKLSYRRKDLSSVTFAAQKAVSLSLFRRFGQILYTVYIVYSLDSSFLLW